MKKHKSNRKRIALIAAILLVAGLGVWYMVSAASSPKKTATKTTAEVAEANKLDKPANVTDPDGDKAVTPSNGSTSTTATVDNLAVIINRPTNGDSVSLASGLSMRTTISGSNSADGTCTLTMTGPSGQKVTGNGTFASQTSYSSCSIDIPGSKLAAGSWSLSFVASSGGATSKPITQTVTVQ